MTELGRVGVWTWAFDRLPWAAVTDAVTEIEDLGFGTIWFGEAARIAERLGKEWGRPVETMRAFLDAMDATEFTRPAPAQQAPRVLAALGPKMLELAAERTRGAHPFFVPVEHTAFARSVIGPDALLAAHVNVVLHDDPAQAWAIARAAVAPWVAYVG